MIKHTLITATLLNFLTLNASVHSQAESEHSSAATTVPLEVFFADYYEELEAVPNGVGSEASTAPTVPFNEDNTVTLVSGGASLSFPDDLGVSVDGDSSSSRASTASATPQPVMHQNAVVPEPPHPGHQAVGHIDVAAGNLEALAQPLEFPAQTVPAPQGAMHGMAHALTGTRCHSEPTHQRGG